MGSDSDGHNGETLFTTWAAGVQGRRHRRQGHKSSQFNHYDARSKDVSFNQGSW